MAEHALFIGWGAPRPGKEAASVAVFQEAVAYWDSLKVAGEIEGVEYVLLGYHGGDLGGFALLRGAPEKLGGVWMSPGFERLTMRAAACLEDVGVVSAYVDAGVVSQLAKWKEAIADLV